MGKQLRNRIRSSPFLKGVLILMSGSVLSQLVPFLASPVLSRIYTPEIFGVYSLFVSTVNILDVFATLKYDMAIVTAKEEAQAVSLLWVCAGIAATLCVLLFLLAPLIPALFPSFAGSNPLWLYWVPVSVLFTSAFSTLNLFCLRLGQYQSITRANIVRAAAAAALQISLGLAGLTIFGLIAGQIISYFAGAFLLWFGARRQIRPPVLSRLAKSARASSDFPRYTLPGTLATTLSYNLVSYFLNAFFLPAQLGYYSVINQALSTPLTVVSGAVGNVFFKRASEEESSGQMSFGTFRSVTRTLFFLSLPIFTALYLFAAPVIRIFLGEQWVPAAAMVRALVPMFLVRFVVNPITTSAIVAGRQSGAMLWQFSLLLVSVIPAAVQLLYPLSAVQYLTLLSWLLAFCYAVFYLYCRRLLLARQVKP